MSSYDVKKTGLIVLLGRFQGKTVDDIVTDGPGLVFVVFPHALSKMPLPQLWSVVFFGMLILLGIDSQVI